MTELSRLSKNSLDWRKEDPFIPQGVDCIEADTGRRKIGAGKRWSDTPFAQDEPKLLPTRTAEAKYFLPTLDEWYKTAYYDPTLNDGAGGYWKWHTGTNDEPAPAKADKTGKGVNGGKGHFITAGPVSRWVNSSTNAVHDVGTDGYPCYWGAYDMSGNCFHICEPPGSHTFSDYTYYNMAGGNVDSGDVPGVRAQLRWTRAAVKYHVYGSRVFTLTDPHGYGDFVDVGSPGNAHCTPNATFGDNNFVNRTGLADQVGAVAYAFKAAKYHLTVAEYVEFLNATAQVDDMKCYFDGAPLGGDAGPASGTQGWIARRGVKGRYYYRVMTHGARKPVGHLSLWSLYRYCNWLHNGKPSGGQYDGTTEQGAYNVNGRTTHDGAAYPTRNV